MAFAGTGKRRKQVRMKNYLTNAVRSVKSFVVNKATSSFGNVGNLSASSLISNFGSTSKYNTNTKPVQKLLKGSPFDLSNSINNAPDPLGFQHLQYPAELTGTEVGNWILFFSISSNVGDNPAYNADLQFAEDMGLNPGKKWVVGRHQEREDTGVDQLREMYKKKGIVIPRVNKTNTVVRDDATKDIVSGAIALYMPPDIKVSYGADWGIEEAGLGGDVAAAWKDLKDRGGFKEMDNPEIVGDIFMHGGTALLQRAKQVVGEVTGAFGMGDWVKLLGKHIGVAINNHKEMFYEGPQFREFSYNFKFWPRNTDETKRVQDIITMFKWHMHPYREAGWKGRMFRYPSEFEIHYLHRTGVNSHLNKISRCALTKCDVSYTPEGGNFKTFEENYEEEPGAPVCYTVELGFKELEFMTKDKIKEGF